MAYTKKIVAGIGDKIQYLARDYSDNTIRFIVRYQGRIHSEILRDATQKVIESVDVLHASFHATDSQAYWLVHEDYTVNDYFQMLETQDDPMEKARELSLLSIQPRDKTQLRCYLIRRMTESVIVLLVSHLCTDGIDAKYLFEKITEAYNNLLEKGNAWNVKVKNGSRATEQIYNNVQKKDYRSLLKNPMAKVKSEFPYPTKGKGTPRMIYVNIPKDMTERVNGFAKLHSVTFNDVLLAACCYAYSELPGKNTTDPMQFVIRNDLRKCCRNGDSEGVSNMMGSVPIQLPNGLGDSFSATLIHIATQTKLAKDSPAAGIEGMPIVHGAAKSLPMKMLTTFSGKMNGNSPISIIDLGDIDTATMELGKVFPDMGVFAGSLRQKPGMQISVMSIDGNCTLCIAGLYSQEDEELLQSMLDRIAAEVKKHGLF